uniref:Putative helicase n=1 Tax=viral metagenome TaxID=1070528 RepID=A0A6M3ME35_9ZZZZ
MVFKTKIFGRAGTGKTTYLLSKLNELLQSGVSSNHIAMVTYTTGAAQVFQERAMKQFGLSQKDIPFFGTMNSLVWKAAGLESKNILTEKKKREFIEYFYPELLFQIKEYPEERYYLNSTDRARLMQQSKIQCMMDIDDRLRNAQIKDHDYILLNQMTGTDLKYKQWSVWDDTEWNEKRKKYNLQWTGEYEYISPDEQSLFCDRWQRYMESEDLYSYSRSLEYAIKIQSTLPVEYLFFDEFQDFSRLQYDLFMLWSESNRAKQVWFGGDDAQSIYRFSSASPEYMLNAPCDDIIHLPKTYRHGEEILKSAQLYLDRMRVVELCEVVPSEKEGTVIEYQGDEWESKFKCENNDESILVIAANKQWVYQIRKRLDELFPDVFFCNLEDMRKVERVFGMYNTIADLDRGESVDKKFIVPFFKGSNALPTKMLVSTSQYGLDFTKKIKSIQVLDRVKKSIREDRFNLRDEYTKETFEQDFLISKWDGLLLINNIPDIQIFPAAPDMFPTYTAPLVNKRIGTIHKAKGDEADTVLLFMSLSYPSLEQISSPAVSDDVLRQFYVGKSRAMTTQIDIYNYLKYSGGGIAPAPFEVIPNLHRQ